jgi:hypothetical protein
LFEVRFGSSDEDDPLYPEAHPGFTYHECVNRFAEQLKPLVRTSVRPNEGKEAQFEILYASTRSAIFGSAATERNQTDSPATPRISKESSRLPRRAGGWF